MRYHVQGVGECIRFEVVARALEPRDGGERSPSLCDERICQAAHAIEHEPWAWTMGASRSGREDDCTA